VLIEYKEMLSTH